MLDIDVIIILIIININSLLIGYLFGRLSNTTNIVSQHTSLNKINKDIIEKNNLEIDDKKFVVDIKTDHLEKKYQSLGEIKKTDENISGSVNKLKNLKR